MRRVLIISRQKYDLPLFLLYSYTWLLEYNKNCEIHISKQKKKKKRKIKPLTHCQIVKIYLEKPQKAEQSERDFNVTVNMCVS